MELHVVGSGSKGNCYLLKDGGQYLALDAGCKFRQVQVACDFEITRIIGCLVTHGHKDHCGYLPKFDEAAIDCYAGVNAVLPIAKASGVTPSRLKDKRWNAIGNWRVLAFDVPHEAEPNYGFLIEAPSGHRLMYLTDFQYSRYTFRRMHINSMLIACNHMDDIEERAGGSENFSHVVRGHSSLKTVQFCIDANKTDDLRNIILCHLSEANADADAMAWAIREQVGIQTAVDIAEKGTVINLG